MELSERLLSVFSATVESDGGRYIIEIPESELTAGLVSEGAIYRLAFLNEIGGEELQPTEPARSELSGSRTSPRDHSEPTLVEGDQLTVEITDLGTEGDGLTTIEDGYVVIVPGTAIGDEVTIEMTSVRENVGFAKVVE